MIGSKSVQCHLVVAALALVLLAGASPARADYASDAGYGLLATVTNLFYMPAKIVYAAAGGLVGGLVYVTTAGDIETAQGVWSPTVGGDYVLTGAMLRGEQPILFVGPTYRRAGNIASDDAWGAERMR